MVRFVPLNLYLSVLRPPHSASRRIKMTRKVGYTLNHAGHPADMRAAYNHSCIEALTGDEVGRARNRGEPAQCIGPFR